MGDITTCGLSISLLFFFLLFAKKNPTNFLSTGTALLDHDLVGSINAQGLQETVLGVVAAGEVGLGLGLGKDVAESKEGSSRSQQTLHSQTSGESPDIGGPDVEDIILLWDLESKFQVKSTVEVNIHLTESGFILS